MFRRWGAPVVCRLRKAVYVGSVPADLSVKLGMIPEIRVHQHSVNARINHEIEVTFVSLARLYLPFTALPSELALTYARPGYLSVAICGIANWRDADLFETRQPRRHLLYPDHPMCKRQEHITRILDIYGYPKQRFLAADGPVHYAMADVSTRICFPLTYECIVRPHSADPQSNDRRERVDRLQQILALGNRVLKSGGRARDVDVPGNKFQPAK